MYTETTNNVRVTVRPIFLEDQSFPNEPHYAWAYHVKLENVGKETVQLLSRYWRIIDASGGLKEVKGAGVVGEQPVLKPGEVYEYTSGTLLPTHSGLMGGTYQMVGAAGELFDITIPTFSLDSPQEFARPN